MRLWSYVSPILWEEEPAPEAARIASEVTGAPAALKAAVRFVLVGFSAVVLTAQMASIRLAAPVDADPSYCITQCIQCKLACPAGSGNAACIKACDDQRVQCRYSQG
jgi:hypothetical protein